MTSSIAGGGACEWHPAGERAARVHRRAGAHRARGGDARGLDRRARPAAARRAARHDRDRGPPGDIVAANEAWRRFGRENGARPAVAEGVGQNYFEICRAAALVGCPPGPRAAAGITRVLRRELPIFTLDYACHGEDEQRWFMLTVTPLESGAVIAHTDITARR